MEPTSNEQSLDESVAQVMRALPPPIRNYVAQEKYTPVTQSLMMKYHLRTDQGGILEREIMLLLMGIESSDGFAQALEEETKLDQSTIGGIMEDINNLIFIPLREQMRQGATLLSQTTRSMPSLPKAPMVNAPVPNYAPPAPVVPKPIAIATPRPVMPATVAPVRPMAPAPQPVFTAAPVIQTPPPTIVPMPVSTPSHFHLENKIAPLPPKVTMPAGRSTPSMVPGEKLLPVGERRVVAPENLPGAMPGPVVPLAPPAPAARAEVRWPDPVAPAAPQPLSPRSAAVPRPPAPTQPPYVADPYREPIEP